MKTIARIIMAVVMLSCGTSEAKSIHLGVVKCTDAPLQIEIIDTLPKNVKWNREYLIVHFLRNLSKNNMYVSISYGVGFEYFGEDKKSQGGTGEHSPSAGMPVIIRPGEAIILRNMKVGYGDMDENGKKDINFHFALISMMVEKEKAPRYINLGFDYNIQYIEFQNMEDIPSPAKVYQSHVHNITTGLKKIEVTP